MKIAQTKTKATLFALIMIFTMVTTLNLLPAVNADTNYADSTIYINVAPKNIGVGQTAVVTFWHDKRAPVALNDADFDTLGGREGWHNLIVTITKPDGTNTTLGPFSSDPVGAAWTSFAPDTVGNYIITASFPGEWKNTTTSQVYFRAATSREFTLTVQQEPVQGIPQYDLPSEYWTRPIEAQNREWYAISGNWLGLPLPIPGRNSCYNATGKWNPYTTAPNTAHIMWTKPIYSGGLVGGEFGESKSYYSWQSYENKMVPTIIMNGLLYYTEAASQGIICLDLRTGEQLWWKSGSITLGQLYDYDSPNQHGVLPYLWQTGSTYKMYDAFTGDLILSMTHASTGAYTYSSDGSLLVYILDGVNNWLAMWNSSSVEGMLRGTSGTNAWQWRPPNGATLDWRTGIQWNVTIPDVYNGVDTSIYGARPAIVRVDDEVIYTRAQLAKYLEDPDTIIINAGYDAETGQQLWVQNRTGSDAIFGAESRFASAMGEGVFVNFKQETLQWYGFDTQTGRKLWVTEPYDEDMGMYTTTIGDGPLIANGKLYAGAYDGKIHAYDIKTGEHLWDYYAGDAGFETPYGSWPFWGSLAGADGKIYAGTGEHSPSSPLWTGEKLHCFDAETGENLWSIAGWMMNPSIADGYLVTHNVYDMQAYCFGKGPSATTVEAPMTAITVGDSVVVQGTVIDIAAGTQQNEQAARFPHGVPAVSDESMSPWMEYLYMQKPRPNNATGVQVTIDALDPNGNYIHIGDATSDTSGLFSYSWKTPDVPGKYTVIATFAGSESFYGSHAETAMVVQDAPVETAPAQAQVSSDNTMMILGVGIAILIAVVVVGALIMMMLRKRP